MGPSRWFFAGLAYYKPNQLIIMQGSNFQADYTHEITKDPNCSEKRISLTFRNHEIREE